MHNYTRRIAFLALATNLAAALLSGSVNATIDANNGTTDPLKLLTANFKSRNVVKIEAGDFHFKPGQVAPIHTHTAPAVGYVIKGEIIYQVEGEKQHILREGDAFFEPVGPRILRFDNASASEEAIFIDFNLQQKGEPFIVFEKPLTEAIDRRELATTELNGKKVERVDIFVTELENGASFQIEVQGPTLGLVAEGVVVFKDDLKTLKRVSAGKTFSLPKGGSKTIIVNASAETSAKIVTFQLK